jgi:hypothetical protein
MHCASAAERGALLERRAQAQLGDLSDEAAQPVGGLRREPALERLAGRAEHGRRRVCAAAGRHTESALDAAG